MDLLYGKTPCDSRTAVESCLNRTSACPCVYAIVRFWRKSRTVVGHVLANNARITLKSSECVGFLGMCTCMIRVQL